MREVAVGEPLDQYRLVEVIARSGMASIFKAVDTLSGAPVAIKVPYLQFENDVIFYSRFQREEEIVRRLKHPNIIHALTPRHKSRVYIAMEYVEGNSLRNLMNDRHGMAPWIALDYARQICGALAYMHAKGVVHRDLKPENVVITSGGIAKIMDFGIALDETARRLTWSGLSSTLGTPDYMAPEQVNGRRGDARTDIYALGVILYEMLTGNLPYNDHNVYGIMRAKTSEDPELPTAFRPDLDTALEEIILHGIERQPRNRYAGAKEMLADLTNPSRVTISRAARLHPHRLRRRHLVRDIGVGVVLASLIGVFAFLVWVANQYPSPASRSAATWREMK